MFSCKGLATRHVSIGTNFTFGHKAAGNFQVLADLGVARDFKVEPVAIFKVDGRPVSSTSIREALAEGDLEWPERALGRRYVVEGHVVTGAGRGRGLGWPTANLRTPDGILLPGRGVYACLRHGRRQSPTRPRSTSASTPPSEASPSTSRLTCSTSTGTSSAGCSRSSSGSASATSSDSTRAEELTKQIERDVEHTRELVASSGSAGAPVIPSTCELTLTKDAKSQLIGEYRRGDTDSGSPEVQVAILSKRIEELTGAPQDPQDGSPLAPRPAADGGPPPASPRVPEAEGRRALPGPDPAARAEAIEKEGPEGRYGFPGSAGTASQFSVADPGAGIAAGHRGPPLTTGPPPASPYSGGAVR